jgi:hypothetical protein
VWQPLLQHMKKPLQGESLVQRHAPLVQRLLLLPQVRPQLPQLLISVASVRQVPLQQVWPEPQLVPQLPQLVWLVRVSMQLPPQQVCPLAQSLLLSHTQRPAWHTKPAGHAAPQALQCWALVCRFVSQPLLAFASQLPKLVLQLDT